MGTKKILEINIPANNRKIIEIVVADLTVTPTPISRKPLILPAPMSLDGEHEINIATEERGDEIIYILTGRYKDFRNNTLA